MVLLFSAVSFLTEVKINHPYKDRYNVTTVSVITSLIKLYDILLRPKKVYFKNKYIIPSLTSKIIHTAGANMADAGLRDNLTQGFASRQSLKVTQIFVTMKCLSRRTLTLDGNIRN